MLNFFSKNKKLPKINSRIIPFGIRVYAIGDIHGRLDLTEKIHQQIIDDAKNFRGERIIVVYCGDYIDRGSQSRQVIECLSNNPLPDFEKIFLKGNHEHAMMMFLGNHPESQNWLLWGGEQTLQSYDVALENLSSQQLSANLGAKLPDKHRYFLSNLKIYYEIGDYIFVHAGLRPNISLEEQKEEDMLMIRDDFINTKKKFNKTIVFGHTIFEKPLVSDDKIGIDTGAYKTDKLTCLVLEGNNRRFLTT